jgi:hypothetical protein
MTIFAFLNYQTMIKITLPDGSKEFALGVTPMDVAKSISEGFARNVIRLPLTVQQWKQPPL